MPSRIEITGEVRDVLPPGLLEDAIRATESNTITCADCGMQITPDSDEAISLVARTNIVGTEPAVEYVHRRCAPSGVRQPDLTLIAGDDITYLPLLRPGHPIPAGLLWEPRLQHAYPPADNAHTSHFRDLGFETEPDGGFHGHVDLTLDSRSPPRNPGLAHTAQLEPMTRSPPHSLTPRKRQLTSGSTSSIMLIAVQLTAEAMRQARRRH